MHFDTSFKLFSHIGAILPDRPLKAARQVINVQDRMRPMPATENFRRARIRYPDEIEIVKAIEEAFTVSGISQAAMNIKETWIERPLESSNHPAIALHVYPDRRLDCKFSRRPCEYFRACIVRTDDGNSYLAYLLQSAADVQRP